MWVRMVISLTSLIFSYLLLATENLSNMVPDPWYSMYHYSHPPLLERLRAINRATEAAEGKKTE